MVCIAAPASPMPPHWHRQFLNMLPAIQSHARYNFRQLRPEVRAEAVAEVIANAFKAFVRLVELGKADIAYATPLARYGVAQTRDHRKVGSSLNVRDVLSPYCRAKKHVVVERLDRYDELDDAWQEILVEDRHAGPAAIAATRLDFDAWLRTLPLRLRRIAKTLASGETTSNAARRFNMSCGRISQIRKELFYAWQHFVGDEPTSVAA